MSTLADVRVPVAVPGGALPRPFTVRSRREETADTATVELVAHDGTALPFRPGQFTMVGVPGFGEVALSVSGDPARPQVLQHTVRRVGNGTAAVVRALVGQTLLVRGPFGTAWPVPEAAGGDLLLVAGGIGLAPLRPALLAAASRRQDYGRVMLLLGARTPADLLYADELAGWQARADLDVRVTVDAAPPSWRGQVGWVSALLPPRLGAGTTALVCGPELMMRLVADALVDRGVPAERVAVSLERNMQCAVGLCGHCQLRELFVCTDGPVVGWDRAAPLLATSEL